MSLFIDKHNRRKSPFSLVVFGMTLLECLLFGVMYGVLAAPLARAVVFSSATATWAVHGLIIAAAGTALSCLFFLAPDKRLVPWGFVGLGVVLGMFCAAALLLPSPDRHWMLLLILAYGLPPVLVGNLVTWPLYLRIKRSAPAPERRKTVRQELMEAAAKEAAKQERKQTRQARPEKEVPPSTPEEALFEPEAGSAPSFRSEEEEAMRLYMDNEDEESDD